MAGPSAAAQAPRGVSRERLLDHRAAVVPFVVVAVMLSFAALPLDRAVVAAFSAATLVVLGATLGSGVIGALCLAFLCLFPFALLLLLRHGSAANRMAIPFGPFLAVGTLVILFGPELTGLPAG